jgi:hypothetical protein
MVTMGRKKIRFAGPIAAPAGRDVMAFVYALAAVAPFSIGSVPKQQYKLGYCSRCGARE